MLHFNHFSTYQTHLQAVKQDLERRHLLDFPGGIVIIGGGAILPGVEELAQEVFSVNVKLFVPNQIGIHQSSFCPCD